MPSPSPQPHSSPTLRERKGEIVLLTFLPLLPRCGRGRGRLCSSPSSRCSHAAGEEGGDCAAHLPPAAPTLRERKGGDCAPHLPPAAPTLRERKGEIVLLTFLLLLPRCGRGRGDEQSKGDPAPVNDTAFTNQITPLPHCGRGAGGEGGPSRNGCASTVRAQ